MKKVQGRLRGAVAVLLAATACVAACTSDDDDGRPATPTTAPPTTTRYEPPAELLAQARAEGAALKLVWQFTPDDQTSTHRAVDALAELFEEVYGFPVALELEPQMPADGNAALLSEGRPSVTGQDVFLGDAPALVTLIDAGRISPFDTLSSTGSDRLVEEGRAVALLTHLYGLTYDASLPEAEVPRTMDQVLETDLTLATHPFGARLEALAVEPFLGWDGFREFIIELEDKFDGTYFCDPAGRAQFRSQGIDLTLGCPLAWSLGDPGLRFQLPEDAGLLWPRYAGLLVDAPHPATAQLWLHLLLSPGGQAVLRDQVHADLHTLEGSEVASVLDDYEAEGHDLTTIDLAFARRYPFPESIDEFLPNRGGPEFVHGEFG